MFTIVSKASSLIDNAEFELSSFEIPSFHFSSTAWFFLCIFSLRPSLILLLIWSNKLLGAAACWVLPEDTIFGSLRAVWPAAGIELFLNSFCRSGFVMGFNVTILAGFVWILFGWSIDASLNCWWSWEVFCMLPREEPSFLKTLCSFLLDTLCLGECNLGFWRPSQFLPNISFSDLGLADGFTFCSIQRKSVKTGSWLFAKRSWKWFNWQQ